MATRVGSIVLNPQTRLFCDQRVELTLYRYSFSNTAVVSVMVMQKKNFVVSGLRLSSAYLLVFISVLCFPCFAANTAKKILVIDSQKGDPYQTVRESMLLELERRGYSKASGFSYEYYSLSHYPGAAKSLWNHKITKHEYDLIFITGTLACKSFREIAWQESKYTFLFAAVTDPVGLGLIHDYGQPPNGNFTGVSFHVSVQDRMNFVRELIPKVKHIGVVRADMSQSHSYGQWLKAVLDQPEWSNVTLHSRQVPFIPSEGGHRRMAQTARKFIEELDPIVDVFLSPADQMGAQSPFARLVDEIATKPLIGIGRHDVFDRWGATASIYPEEKLMGVQAAIMADRLLQGEPIESVFPEQAEAYGIAIDVSRAKKFGIEISDELKQNAILIGSSL